MGGSHKPSSSWEQRVKLEPRRSRSTGSKVIYSLDRHSDRYVLQSQFLIKSRFSSFSHTAPWQAIKTSPFKVNPLKRYFACQIWRSINEKFKRVRYLIWIRLYFMTRVNIFNTHAQFSKVSQSDISDILYSILWVLRSISWIIW